MGENTKIEWAHHTFNPWYGCQKVGPGCDHCYAEWWAKRSGLVQWGPGTERRRSSAANWRNPIKWNRQAQIKIDAWDKFKETYPGLTDAQLIEQGFAKPERPRVFCASLADVFDNAVPREWRMDLFDLIARTPHLDWLIVTKRIGNVMQMCQHDGLMFDQLANIWLGITVCNQEEADRDIPKLLVVPARVRFLSMEPLLGAVDLHLDRLAEWNELLLVNNGDADGIHVDWVIVGGESGAHARPMHPGWVRGLRDQCKAAGVPLLFKQWGEFQIASVENGHFDCDMTRNGAVWLHEDGVITSPSSHRTDGGSNGNTYAMTRAGKKATGRLLDGVQHDGYPEVQP